MHTLTSSTCMYMYVHNICQREKERKREINTTNNHVITSESLHLRDVCLCGDKLSPPSELPALIPDPLSTPIPELEPVCVPARDYWLQT